MSSLSNAVRSSTSVLLFDLLTKVFSFRFFFASIVQRLNQGFCYKAESKPHNAGIRGLIIRILVLTIQRQIFLDPVTTICIVSSKAPCSKALIWDYFTTLYFSSLFFLHFIMYYPRGLVLIF